MSKLFIYVLNMSLTASAVIVFILFARLLLKRAPKIFSHALWAAAAFRLLCPFSISAVFSVFGRLGGKTTENGSIEYIAPPAPRQTSGSAFPFVPSDGANPLQSVVPVVPEAREMSFVQLLGTAAAYIWLAGLCAMLIYGVVSFIRLKMRLSGAVRLRPGIYLADHIPTAFVTGFFRPAIYLPSSIAENERDYIILHEETHIRRLDHITKIIAFIALSIHWFNPLVWLAFNLFSKDMEMSCDESVMKKMNKDIRCDYSAALLRLSGGRKSFTGAPLAFGEGNAKNRVKNILNYRKASFWVVLVSFLCVAALCVVLVVNPKTAGDENERGKKNAEPPVMSASLSTAVPDFLDREQADLYRRAHSIFAIFSGNPQYIMELPLEDGTFPEVNYGSDPYSVEGSIFTYYPVSGRYATWEDFEAMCLSLFTEEYYREINKENIFINVDGKCYYADVAKGSSFGYTPEEMPDTFELLDKTGSRINFIMSAYYYIDGYVEGETRSDYYILNFPISMELTGEGWRFSRFNIGSYSEPSAEYNSASYLEGHADALSIMTADEDGNAPYGCGYTRMSTAGEASSELFSSSNVRNGFNFGWDSKTKYIALVFTGQTPGKISVNIFDENGGLSQSVFDSGIQRSPYRLKLPAAAGKFSYIADIEWFNGAKDRVAFFVNLEQDNPDANVFPTASLDDGVALEDILNAQQLALFEKGMWAYPEMSIMTSGFDALGRGEKIEQNGYTYYQSDGSFTKWDDFYAQMTEIFTEDYFKYLNGGNGDEPTYIDVNGDLYCRLGDRGGNIMHIGPDTYELVSKSDDMVEFNIIGHYYPYFDDNFDVNKINWRDWHDSEYIKIEKWPIRFVNTDKGWRIEQFNISY